MALRLAQVEVRWDEEIRHLRELEEDQASSEDGIGLNHGYVDYRGVSIAEAIEGVEEEAQLLVNLAKAGWDTDDAEAFIEENAEAAGLTAALDAGVAGLVLAMSALGATPISSCNGGLAGVSEHRSDVPHVLFTAPESVMDRLIPAAKACEVGIIFDDGFAEAFADYLPNLHRMARLLLGLSSLAALCPPKKS